MEVSVIKKIIAPKQKQNYFLTHVTKVPVYLLQSLIYSNTRPNFPLDLLMNMSYLHSNSCLFIPILAGVWISLF